MAIVTGLFAERIKELLEAMLVDATIDADGNLSFTTNGGASIEVGNLRGPQGNPGPAGAINKVNGKTGSEITLTPADLGVDLTGVIPSGTIVITGRATAASGYLLCQGQALARTGTYANLFAALGTSFGAGDGVNTFNIPDLRGKTPIGRYSSDTDFDTLGETGGTKKHGHALSQAWAYVTLASNYLRIGRRNTASWDATVYSSTPTASSAAEMTDGARLGGTTDDASNLPPYQVVNYMIKV